MIACPGFTASNVRFSALTADGSAQGETPRNEAKMMTSAEDVYKRQGGYSVEGGRQIQWLFCQILLNIFILYGGHLMVCLLYTSRCV